MSWGKPQPQASTIQAQDVQLMPARPDSPAPIEHAYDKQKRNEFCGAFIAGRGMVCFA